VEGGRAYDAAAVNAGAARNRVQTEGIRVGEGRKRELKRKKETGEIALPGFVPDAMRNYWSGGLATVGALPSVV